MKLVDANVLLYAVNESAEHHDDAVGWLDDALNGQSTVGFSWISLLAFLRLSTKVGLFPAPLPADQALERVHAWLDQPTSVLVEPTARHLDVLGGLLVTLGSGGNLTNDAHLAALAIEHRGEIITYDSDFGRFTGVAWSTPASRPGMAARQDRSDRSGSDPGSHPAGTAPAESGAPPGNVSAGGGGAGR